MAQIIKWQVSLQGTTLDNGGPNQNANGVTVHNVGPLYWDVVLSDPELYPLAAEKANAIFEPVGPDYGGACVLMTYGDVQDIQNRIKLAQQAWSTDLVRSFSVSCTVTNEENPKDPGANSVTIANLWFHKATRVDYGDLTDDSVYMVEFVDEAYLLSQCTWINYPGYEQFNRRRPYATYQSNSTALYSPPGDPDRNYWYDTQTIFYNGYFAQPTRWEWDPGAGPSNDAEYTAGYRQYQDLYGDSSADDGTGGIFWAVWNYQEPTDSISTILNGNYPSNIPPITNIQLAYNGGMNKSAWPGLPYKPKGAPQNVLWSGKSIWTAIHETLINRLGCTMVRRHDQQYRWDCVLLGDEQEGVQDLENQSAPNLLTDTCSLVNPLLTTGQYNVVHARQTRMAGDFTLDSEIGTCKRLSELAEILTSNQGESLLTRIIHSDMPGFWFGEANSTSTIPGTGVSLQQSADDFAQHQDMMWRAPAGKQTYIGVMPFKPGQQVKSVYWHDYGSGMFTTVIKYPGPPRRLRGHDGRINTNVTWTDCETFGSPKARKGVKIVPDLCQVIQLTSGTGDDELYSAQVISAPDPVDCYAKCEQDCDHLINGSGYIGRFVGTHSDGKAIFLIQDLPGMDCTSVVTGVSGTDSEGHPPVVTTQKFWIPDRCS